MPFKEPSPSALRLVNVGTTIPRALYQHLQTVAETKGCSVSKILRAVIVEAYSPERDDRKLTE